MRAHTNIPLLTHHTTLVTLPPNNHIPPTILVNHRTTVTFMLWVVMLEGSCVGTRLILTPPMNSMGGVRVPHHLFMMLSVYGHLRVFVQQKNHVRMIVIRRALRWCHQYVIVGMTTPTIRVHLR